MNDFFLSSFFKPGLRIVQAVADFFPSCFFLQTGLRNRMIEVAAVEDNGFFPQHSLAAHGVALISFEITY